jgi:hypothetical protein
MLAARRFKEKTNVLKKCACTIALPTALTTVYVLTSAASGNAEYVSTVGVGSISAVGGFVIDAWRYFHGPEYKSKY